MRWMASSLEVASTLPFWGLPALLSASYAKVGMSNSEGGRRPGAGGRSQHREKLRLRSLNPAPSRVTPASRRLLLGDRLAHNLVDRRLPLVDRHEPALAERAHAALAGVVAQHVRAGLLHHQLAHLVVHHEDLEDRHAAAVAGLVAVVAPAAAEEVPAPDVLRAEAELHELLLLGLVLLLALGADGPHQALGDDPLDRRRQEEGLEPEVQKTDDRAGRVVGVQRRQHQVAGERRLDR